MLDYRLKKEKDWSLVFNKGKRLFSSSLTLVYFPANELKVGYAVGKKHGGSVKRNRIKRLLRESFRSFSVSLKKNFFFVFIPKVDKDLSLEILKDEMHFLFSKGGFYN
ncbi:MAG: ribonuclease P protein component [Clostridia bacterium]|nr:ribonuclease P protein component [Clostridia bacterium]